MSTYALLCSCFTFEAMSATVFLAPLPWCRQVIWQLQWLVAGAVAPVRAAIQCLKQPIEVAVSQQWGDVQIGCCRLVTGCSVA